MKLLRISHNGRSVVRSVQTNDAKIYAPISVSDAELDRRVARMIAGRRTRDSMLNAISPGKVLALGTVWTGSLAPEIDSRLDALRPIVSGLTSGNRLNAEPAGASLDMGRRWVGDIVGMIRAGAHDSEGREGERVDLTGLARSAERLEDAFEKGNRDLIRSAAEQLRQDFEMVREKHADSARRTADAAFADRGAREAAATRDTIRSMNQANRDFWNAHSYNGTGAPTPAAAVAPLPTRTRDWAMDVPGGSPFINAANMKHSTPRTPSIAEINRRNARFWAERNGDDLPPAA